MSVLRLFTSFEGRIGRAAFWFGLIVLLAISPFTFAIVFGKAGILQMLASLGIGGMVWTLVLLYPLTALIIKRMRDRNRTPLMAALFSLPAVLTTLSGFTSWLSIASSLTYLTGLLNVYLGGISVRFLIELGFYPGRVQPQNFVSPSRAPAKGKRKARA
jgi:uncharacterized membrane protein YhaH (DUF805 family)